MNDLCECGHTKVMHSGCTSWCMSICGCTTYRSLMDMPLCACGHEAALHPMIASYRSRCHAASGCHCKRYQQLTFRCFRCSNFALEGYRHCRQCMKELAAAGKGPTTHYPCAWCGTWEASKGEDLCPKCAEADETSPITPPQYNPRAVNFTTPVWSILKDVPLDTVVEDYYGDHWKCLSSTGLWYIDKPWDEATTYQIDRAEGPFRFVRTITADPFSKKEEPAMPKITTTTTTSISSSDGFTVGGLQSFLDQVRRWKGLDTPVGVEFGVGSTVTLSVTSEDES